MKTIILLEMALLAYGGLAYRRNVKKEDWQTILFVDSTKVFMAVLVLSVLLLSADEIGLGVAAALFGFLIDLGYLLGAVGWFGPAFESLNTELLG